MTTGFTFFAIAPDPLLSPALQDANVTSHPTRADLRRGGWSEGEKAKILWSLIDIKNINWRKVHIPEGRTRNSCLKMLKREHNKALQQIEKYEAIKNGTWVDEDAIEIAAAAATNEANAKGRKETRGRPKGSKNKKKKGADIDHDEDDEDGYGDGLTRTPRARSGRANTIRDYAELVHGVDAVGELDDGVDADVDGFGAEDLADTPVQTPGKKRGRPSGSMNKPKVKPEPEDDDDDDDDDSGVEFAEPMIEGLDAASDTAEEALNEDDAAIDSVLTSPAQTPKKRGRPFGSKNKPKPRQTVDKANRMVDSDEESEHEGHNAGTIIADSPATPGQTPKKRGRPFGSKNKPKVKSDLHNDDDADMATDDFVTPPKKRGRPHGTKPKPQAKPELQYGDNDFDDSSELTIHEPTATLKKRGRPPGSQNKRRTSHLVSDCDSDDLENFNGIASTPKTSKTPKRKRAPGKKATEAQVSMKALSMKDEQDGVGAQGDEIAVGDDGFGDFGGDDDEFGDMDLGESPTKKVRFEEGVEHASDEDMYGGGGGTPPKRVNVIDLLAGEIR